MTDFGAFIALEEGIDALLHVSQISRAHVAKPSDILKIGQEIEAQVVDFNEADKKISLSIKVLENASDDRGYREDEGNYQEDYREEEYSEPQYDSEPEYAPDSEVLEDGAAQE